VQLAVSTSETTVRAWETCKEWESADVILSVFPGKEKIAFSIRRGRPIVKFLGMSYNEEQVKCTGPFGDNGAEVKIDLDTRFELTTDKVLPITCDRSFHNDGNGGSYADSSDIVLRVEGRDPLLLSLPREEKYGVTYGREIISHIQQIQDRILHLEQALLTNASLISETKLEVETGRKELFKVTDVSNYTIKFERPFRKPPQVLTALSQYGTGLSKGAVRGVTEVVSVSENEFVLKAGTWDGNIADHVVSWIAIGNR
jgi:hypothetical protein